MAFLGFSAGLPYLLVFSTLTAWLRDAEVSRSAIGFFAWVGITYSVKVLWAPVVDRIPILYMTRRLGQRRSWMLLAQFSISGGLLLISFVGPADLILLSLIALFVAFSSATQDIAIDAYRIEAAIDKYQGAMAASYIFGYRIALLVAGAGCLYLADFFGWVFAYQIMAISLLVGMFTVALISEPKREESNFDLSSEKKILSSIAAPRFFSWFAAAVISPFVDFFSRNGKFALLILLFISVFRLSDIAMGVMSNPFYLDMGYSLAEIASVVKIFGFFMTIAGSFFCGLLVVKYGIYVPLLIGAISVSMTNLLFAGLSLQEPEIRYLAVVISADNLSGGFAATAFVAYLSSITNRAYTATQYALFSSIMTFPGKFVSGFSGIVVDQSGYFDFFILAGVLGIPAIVLVLIMLHHFKIDKNIL
ncbi:MAG: MFS transporter [OM182 bacterium]|uniref:MFS transporter n=1 Tax=OM182 bacterium TaxID=2510334 RepID=A0A520S523_9GAMM|nr:MAG: MFS transporter [OM182 bacterium]